MTDRQTTIRRLRLTTNSRSSAVDIATIESAIALLTADAALEERVRVLEGVIKDLADAARNSCDARLHPSLIDALAEADRATLTAEQEPSE